MIGINGFGVKCAGGTTQLEATGMQANKYGHLQPVGRSADNHFSVWQAELPADLIGNTQACGEARRLNAEQVDHARHIVALRTLNEKIGVRRLRPRDLGADAAVGWRK